MHRTPAVRARVVAVVLSALSLLLVGSGAAWASWVVSRTVTVTGAGAQAPVPVVTVGCSPQDNGQSDPVVVSWAPVAVPAGATQVRYRVTFTSGSSTVLFPSVGETTATSVSVLGTQMQSGDRTKTQSITVQAFFTLPTGTWTSAPSAAVTARGQNATAGTVDMYC